MFDMHKQQYINNEYRTTMIFIESYADKTLCGKIRNPYLGKELKFTNVMQFLIQMEALLDMMDYPQSFAGTRKFWNNATANQWPQMPDSEASDSPQAGLASFALKVIFRQHASWQGSLHWLDEHREESFRSVLELLKLIDEALTRPNELASEACV